MDTVAKKGTQLKSKTEETVAQPSDMSALSAKSQTILSLSAENARKEIKETQQALPLKHSPKKTPFLTHCAPLNNFMGKETFRPTTNSEN